VILLLLSCGKVPDHLRVEPPPDAGAVDRRVSSGEAAVALLTRRDPLVRSPIMPDRASAEALGASDPWLLAWIDATAASEASLTDPDAALEQLESAWRGTPVVALTRGQRLRLSEGVLARSEVLDEAGEGQILGWLTPLRSDEADIGLPRLPLDWLAPPHEAGDATRVVGERWVVAGWLDGPAIPLRSLSESLAGSNYDGLRETPLGALLLARAERRTGPVDAGFAALRDATTLALNQAAADRDTEQRAWADMKTAAAARVGAADPEKALLATAREKLTAAAGDDRAAGGAFLAYAASRWHDSCPDAPCLGVDRVAEMAAARRWHPEVAELAAIWQVIALKEAVDHMDVAADTVGFPGAMVGLVDALDGTGAGPLSADLLRVRRGEPRTWSGLAAALGVEGVAEWTAARAAIGRHLEQAARDALTLCSDPTLTPLLERVAKRAQP
jgi:hypothetical protein